MYIPDEKSLVVTYNNNYNGFGYYIGGYVTTTFPQPYIYTTMRDEVDLTKIDEVYFNGVWKIIKIDGWEVSSEFGYNIDDNSFT